MTYTPEELTAIAANIVEYVRRGIADYAHVDQHTGQTHVYEIDLTPGEKCELLHEAHAIHEHAKSQKRIRKQMKAA